MTSGSRKKYFYTDIPKIIRKYEEYESGANVPDRVTVHECLCGKGTVEHHSIPGFDDDYFDIQCAECNKKYSYICQSGYQWEIYLS
jgi:hypothetical protein